ncbi:hypothetical protein GCM10007164_20340 [Luteimonas padinae]|uniref:ATP-binding protein n=1 Tax=Luteimonas padinae TaxID=1714359 RepID=A0ABV6SVN6_9GAMM|nr:hypothetical protein [Luteimonas padinae]GHD72577.1 hypothetical protein GCM10007164_20340 [Luteimonas padinae]
MLEIIPHRNFLAAQARLRRALTDHRPGRLIVVIGVGGVGKTTLRWSVLRELYGNPRHWGIGKIPVIEVMAILGAKAYFNSKALAEESLDQLHMPDLSWLTRGAKTTPEIEMIEEALAASREFWKGASRNLTEAGSWNAFKKNARERDMKIFSLEHASALCINHKDTRPAQHIINLMSIMEATGAMGVLTTIQDGAALWKGRSEVRRRMDVIWMAPYDVSKPEDLKCYLGLLKRIAAPYSFNPQNLLERLAPEIAAATAAVYAEMVNLFQRAEESAHDAGRTELIEADFHEAYYSADDLETLWSDVARFWEVKRSDKASAVTERADKLWPTEDE